MRVSFKNQVSRVVLAFCLGLGVLLPHSVAHPAPTNVLMRDPSTIIKKGDTYWVYGTGKGIPQYSSTDRIHWTARGQVFEKAPAWIAGTVLGSEDNFMVSPDVHRINGQYYLYYSVTKSGTNASAIGLAMSPTLEPGTWVDQGAVIVTRPDTDYDALEPCVFDDIGGRPWLAFGFAWSGIKVLPLDPKTGGVPEDAQMASVAARPGVAGNPIAGASIAYHDGWYYLFTSWDSGVASHIRMGRSHNPKGPYKDKEGKDLMEGGGSLFLTSTYDNGSGRPCDDQSGPRGVGIMRDGDEYWINVHYEQSRFSDGATTMYVNGFSWGGDDWPQFILDPGPFKIVTSLPAHNVLTVANADVNDGAEVQSTYFRNDDSQWWRLRALPNGYYLLINQGSNKALTLVGDATKPGVKPVLMTSQNLESQQWYLQQNEDGTYQLLSKLSGKTIELDIANGSNNDGVPVGTWTVNGGPWQKWSFRVR